MVAISIADKEALRPVAFSNFIFHVISQLAVFGQVYCTLGPFNLTDPVSQLGVNNPRVPLFFILVWFRNLKPDQAECTSDSGLQYLRTRSIQQPLVRQYSAALGFSLTNLCLQC